MFDGIEMDIIDVPGKVGLVADGMLPEPPLPKRKIAIWPVLDILARSKQFVAEVTLDPSPPAREIRIIRRQGQNSVKVIREDHNRVNGKWSFVARRAEGET